MIRLLGHAWCEVRRYAGTRAKSTEQPGGDGPGPVGWVFRTSEECAKHLAQWSVSFAESSELFEKGMMFCVPAGARHNVINTGNEPLKLFTIYAPPQHAAGTIHETKAQADAAEAVEATHVGS